MLHCIVSFVNGVFTIKTLVSLYLICFTGILVSYMFKEIHTGKQIRGKTTLQKA